MKNYEKCPFCEKIECVKNGKTKANKYGKQKQKYLCKNCGKQFISKQKPLSRTEKRLFSLLYNLVHYEAQKGDTLKKIATACNKEVNSIGKLEIELTNDDIDLNKVEDVKIIICQNKNNIKIIKTYPKEIIIKLEDLTEKMKTFFDKYN